MWSVTSDRLENASGGYPASCCVEEHVRIAALLEMRENLQIAMRHLERYFELLGDVKGGMRRNQWNIDKKTGRQSSNSGKSTPTRSCLVQKQIDSAATPAETYDSSNGYDG